jgi:hypothetical protein
MVQYQNYESSDFKRAALFYCHFLRISTKFQYLCNRVTKNIKKGLIKVGGKKVHQTEEEKYQQSLKSWGEDDNRPFVRIKINVERDNFEYDRKRKKIIEEKLRISKITGDPIENIHLIDPWGHEYSKGGHIREFLPEQD